MFVPRPTSKKRKKFATIDATDVGSMPDDSRRALHEIISEGDDKRGKKRREVRNEATVEGARVRGQHDGGATVVEGQVQGQHDARQRARPDRGSTVDGEVGRHSAPGQRSGERARECWRAIAW